ncbi:DUF5667 domain-containing protein [Streptomyces sp. TRM 70351]|uniref:DUF5667 domain-containing protein n=1 Tax=Streptomyces sp. TRM 70351 TaxID=3116552 RepID=UPI002E7B8820|nr:DUF5667 domain-containing protein [Streptomyces sp. TRM 70351]MEE1931483.1 DUF5667 domain-containing protein [Streptomyces sp. TRM 70351]
MIGSVSTNRRANAFAQALDERATPGADDATGTAPPGEDPEQGVMLALAEGLGGLPAPELDPEVKAVQRAQLIAAMENQFAVGGTPVPEQRGHSRKGAHRAAPLGRLRPRSRLSKGLAAGGLTVGVAAGAFSGVAAASTDALPGDTLYGLKRGMEDLKLGMADDESERGLVHLDHASVRLNEVRRLMERDRAGALDHESLTEVRKALTAMRVNAAEGHRLLSLVYERDGQLAPIRSLSAFADSHRTTWSQLRNRLPVQLADVGQEVTSVFDAIKQDVEPLARLVSEDEDDKGAPDHRSPGGDGSGGTGQKPGSAPSAPASASGDRPAENTGPSETEREPSPSESGQGRSDEPEGGLIGNPGLLKPPARDDDSPGTTAPPRAPDITIPPLLPGGLPGLGLDVGGDR